MAEALKARILESAEAGFLSLTLGLGSDLGLFKLMKDIGRPFKSEELAKAGGYKERYVYEWLCAMATSKIIDFDAEKEEFAVSSENLDCLIAMTTLSSAVSVLGNKQSQLKNCFKLEGPSGIDQSAFPDFGIWLDSVRDTTFVDALNLLVLSIPGLKEKLESGITVADVGCGVGKMAAMIADRFPNSTVWALDIDSELLKTGQQRAAKKGQQNMHFERTDIQNVQDSLMSKFDYVFSYDVIHDLPHPKGALEQIYKILKVGGIFSMIEPDVHSSLEDNIDAPNATHNYFFSLYLCLPHSLSIPGGEGWGRSMGEERGKEFLKQAGFTDFTIQKEHMNHFICRK